MSLFRRSVGVEFRKILTRRKYYVLLLGELLIAAVAILFTSFNGWGIMGFHMDLPAIPYTILNFLIVFVLPMTIFMISADLFTHEIETGMIKAVLLRPISRFQIYTSKVAAAALYVFLHLMTICFMILAEKIILGSSVDLFGIAAAYAISTFPMIAFVTFSSMICLLVANSSLAMFASVILYIIMQGLTVISAPVGAVFFTSHLNIYRMIVSGSLHSPLLNTLLLFLAYIALTGVAAFALFDRKEF